MQEEISSSCPQVTALESDAFPFEMLSDIAQAESWRKEINRPIYHIHKWWAQRLGSVFRGIAISAFSEPDADIMKLYYSRTRVSEGVVFDPFMGSGTTIGETLKLGARAIGRDINPVAHFLVKTALAKHDKEAIISAYEQIEKNVSDKIKAYYRSTDKQGNTVEVLYYFWVKQVECPSCSNNVELFSKYIFSQHAYKKKYPLARALCPNCGEINETRFDSTSCKCTGCQVVFDPQEGPANRQSANCPDCKTKFKITDAVRSSSNIPIHRMYAKMVLLPDGSKAYLPITDEDIDLYDRASLKLSERRSWIPEVNIEPGHNTNQAIGYNYRLWSDMFNDRQLLCLSLLMEEILRIEDQNIRELFVCLFSGALEFNNMFASFKGEGTGAVRHMFAHHILKPERVPLEANLWGTSKSSGSFSTMFKNRILRALEYSDNPFEQRVGGAGKKNEKIYGLSDSLGFRIATDYERFSNDDLRVYLSCGSSSETDIPNDCVDAIITDPPFFDNVHYSELADFFYVWQKRLLDNGSSDETCSTRSLNEVQNADVETFTNRLKAVWSESFRVLKPDGILAFTYHHSKSDGWFSVLKAIIEAGFVITATQPIKAEMSVAMPKNQAKEPIDLDIIIVCRKRQSRPVRKVPADLYDRAETASEKQIFRFKQANRNLSRNDVRVILMAHLIKELSYCSNVSTAEDKLESLVDNIELSISNLYSLQEPCA